MAYGKSSLMTTDEEKWGGQDSLCTGPHHLSQYAAMTQGTTLAPGPPAHGMLPTGA